MSDLQRALLVGATGLVGRQVIEQGRDVPGLALLALSRREMALPRGGRMEMLLAPVAEWPEAIGAIGPDVVICALGTTQALSGREGLRAVDCTLVLDVARAALKAGATHFVHLSSVGADPHARTHYLRVKGEAEEALRKLGFARLDILRSGLLRGRREGERRVLETVGQIVAPLADLLLQGEARRFRSVSASVVAAAMLQAARTGAQGTFVHEHDAIARLARGLTQTRPE